MNTFASITLFASILLIGSTFLPSIHKQVVRIGEISISVQKQTIEYETNTHCVSIVFPQFPAICPTINEAIENAVQKKLNDYITLCNSREARECLMGPPETGWYININYTIVQANQRYLSLIVHYEEWVGGVHESKWDECFNYDLRTNKELTIPDLEPSPCCLEVMSNLCYQKIGEQYEVSDPKKPAYPYNLLGHDGLLPIAKNFEKFTFTEDSINIHFQEYQITSYSMGAPKVALDRKELRHYLVLGKGPFVPPVS